VCSSDLVQSGDSAVVAAAVVGAAESVVVAVLSVVAAVVGAADSVDVAVLSVVAVVGAADSVDVAVLSVVVAVVGAAESVVVVVLSVVGAELVSSPSSENQPRPPVSSSAGGAAASSVGAAAAASSAGGAVSAVCAGVAGTAGSATGAPIVSSTTGTSLNWSAGADGPPAAAAGICEWTSATTGTFCCATRCLVAAGRCAAREAVATGEAVVRTSGGSAGSRCTFGTWKTGNGSVGSESAGNGADTVRAGSAGVRHAATIGMTYIRISTASPMEAHQYRTPLDLRAVSPYGCAAATDEYEPVVSPFSPRLPPRCCRN